MSGSVKPWQIVLFAAAVLALGFAVYFSVSGDDVEFAESVVLADLETGELVEAGYPKGRAVSMPATHPTTKKRSLFPVTKKDGTWFVASRYLPYVKEFVEKPDALLDPKTGAVKVANESPKRLEVF